MLVVLNKGKLSISFLSVIIHQNRIELVHDEHQ